MHYFAGLRILLRTFRVRLSSRQNAEDATCKRWIHPQALQRRNNSIPAEYCAKPWDTSVRIRPVRCCCPHHVEIGQRTIQPIVELFVLSKNLGLFGALAFERTGCLLHNFFVARLDLDTRIAVHLASNRASIVRCFTGFKTDVKSRCGLR